MNRTCRHISEAVQLSFGPGAHLVATGGADGTVRVWTIATGKTPVELRGQVGAVRDLAFSPRATLLASASNDGTARVFRLSDKTPVAVMSGHTSPVTEVSFSPDGTRIVTASVDGTARVWKAETGAGLAVLRGHQGTVTAARFVGDGSDVVTGSSDDTVRFWYSLQQPVLPVLVEFSRPVVRLRVLSAKRLEAVTDDGVAHMLDARGRLRGERAARPVPPVTSAAGAVATIDGKLVRISQPGGTEVVLRGHAKPVTSVRFSPDGAFVVTASRDTTARIWDARSGALLHTLRGHFGAVNDAEFSPDGRWVLTAGPVTAGLWSADSGTLLFYVRGHRGPLTAATFDPSGDRIYTAGVDGTVRTYDCEVCRSGAALVAVARRRLAQTGRALTPAERARFVP